MNNYAIPFFLLIFLNAHSQGHQKFIDHDFKYGAIKGMHATDSSIYYIQTFPYSHGSYFSAIDYNGNIHRTEIADHNWGTPKFYDYNNDSLSVVYYNTVDDDYTKGEIIDHRFYNAQHTFKIWDVGIHQCQDVIINKTGDRLTILNVQSNQFPPSSLIVFGNNDILLYELELQENMGFHQLVQTKDHGNLLIGTNHIIKLEEDLTMQVIYNSTSEIRTVLQGEMDEEVYVLFNDKVEVFNLNNLDKEVLFAHDIIFEKVKYAGDRFVFYTLQNDNHLFTSINISGLNETVFYENTFFNNILYFDILENSTHLSYYPEPINPAVFARTPIFENILDPSIDEECVDISLDYSSVHRYERDITSVDTTIIGFMDTSFVEYSVYHFLDTLIVTNQGNISIDSFDIHSSKVYPVNSNAPALAQHTLRNYNLEVGETRIIIDSFIVPYYANPFDSISFIIPGGNHLLDCYPEDNSYTDYVITTSIKNLDVDINSTIIYPNPVADMLFIKNLSEPIAYTVFNNIGQIMLQGIVQESIDISVLMEGMYFIKIENTIQKFLKI